MSVADVMAYKRLFAAYFTYFSHDDFSLSIMELVLVYHQRLIVKRFF